MSVFSKNETIRYGRQLLLPQVGLEGQTLLKKSSVLIVGAGGLGSPLAFYLAAVGVGRLGIIDFDNVDESNLHRQILYQSDDIGRKKTTAAKERLLATNPNIVVETFEKKLDSGNALDIIKKYDVVADGTDNFATRYLVNDACMLLAKPNVYGSISQFEGQVTVFDKNLGPCYRCLYPNPPNPNHVQNCGEAGVLGVLPGIIGTLQATETIKVLLNIGESLIGSLLLYDALDMTFEKISVKKNPNCPICGPNPAITELIDYNEFCDVDSDSALRNFDDISPLDLLELVKKEKLTFLDVRESFELEISSFKNSISIPLGELAARLSELDKTYPIVVVCRVGERSKMAAHLLRKNGFNNVINLLGGLNAWAQEVDPTMTKY